MNIAKKPIPPIMPIWQPVGCSTHLIAKKVSDKLKIKTSHTGTLDPLAQGVIIILTGEERLKKYEYAEWLKSYEFDIVFGYSTDTYDPMGMITNNDPAPRVDFKALEKELKKFKGDYSQTVPYFSAIKVKGKSMHEHARADQLDDVEVPVRSGKILKIDLLQASNITIPDFVETSVSNISKVVGDFRQKQIIKQWKEIAKTNKGQILQLATINVQLTKGLYVRSLTVDIANRLNSAALCTNIIRTKNGEYSQENSMPLDQVL